MGADNVQEQDMSKDVEKSLKEYIGTISFLIAGMAFILRGMWYFYHWGYFTAFKIDKSYLLVNNDNALYSTLGLLGVAVALCVSNYWLYAALKSKHIGIVAGTFLFEMIVMFIIICLTSNIDKVELVEYFQIMGWTGILYIVKEAFICASILNIYGIVYYFLFLAYHKISKNENNESILDNIVEKIDTNNKRNVKETILFIIYLIVLSCILGIYVFLMGMNDANEKENFRIIEERYIDSEEYDVEEKYIFVNDKEIRKKYYIVLYETEEYYIGSLAFVGEHGIEKDINRQKIIPKDNISTYYCSNIQKAFEDIYDAEIDTDSNKTNNNTMNEGEKSMSNIDGVIIGAIAGALSTGVCTIIVEIVKRIMSKKAQQSHAATMLYYDLKSIEDYLQNEKSSVNIRYTSEWQEMLSNCDFLDDKKIAYLYKIYDEVYNYNYHYGLKEKMGTVCKEEIQQYIELQSLFKVNKDESKESDEKNNKEYEDILKKLRKYKKK